MLVKKSVLIGTALAFLALPIIANADFLSTNNTNEDSTVKVTSGKIHPCAGTIGQFTPAHGELRTPWGQVRGLCLTSGDNCTADIYMTKDCSGPVIGVAAMDLSHQNVTMAYSVDPRYSIHADGGTHVVIDYTAETH